ncbi:hypothetical protein NDU88_000781 [Pleurodeles waltl]|uniref:Uncharacterized protein n=1 Tax=Pleurodeles waltl TaxID=8319 RepID=A0AAV7PAN3_PLEWA|nr:hypothetical protein NDU88_000781 [Pleurodeles waltl]
MSPGKSTGKPARQLLLTEALLQPQPNGHFPKITANRSPDTASDQTPDGTMERILQEIFGRRLESMDSNISALMAEPKSVPLDIAGFQTRTVDLQLRVASAEDCLNTLLDRDQELQYFRSRVSDLEDRSRRDNACFFGPQNTWKGRI